MQSAGFNDVSPVVAKFQKNEITEHHIYRILAARERDGHNREILNRIAEEEMVHYKSFMGITGKTEEPDRIKIFWYSVMAGVFGLTFTIKLMENGENKAYSDYTLIKNEYPETGQIIADEEKHELELAAMINEERLNYAGSVVLGLNDALVELTGALAGFSFALQDTTLIGAIGLITGIAAALSMATSEYLSEKAEGSAEKDPLRAATYTGAAYIVTVFLLILPYFLFKNYIVALGATLAIGIAVIFIFNFYIAVAKELEFRRRFLEMAAISLGVAALSFILGAVVKIVFGVDV
ncbi:VIT1/CCC1 family predicted Fe2+/Mn2+ transporter [Methanomicrobium sp. W14]|uniref:VIT1/CCC1 transporter family protein n=1 Tax=Methanomicrobium sp. W14 TaxID=2817839 RepID=UPI001AE17FA5|nr:VIT1/CCC1 transporter family protein [Methanomicrobium sp. W14]MBP2133057.1 VIT1/CCC1 family predicted Fe2+/Mn2+ transporter [Methanomicrobium sp. W14]